MPIKSVICGFKTENIENELTRKARHLDKLKNKLSKATVLDIIQGQQTNSHFI